MNEETTAVEKKTNTTHPPRGVARRAKSTNPKKRYPFDLKLKAVRLYLDEGFTGRLIAQETGVSQQALSGWVRIYQESGEEGLKAHTAPSQRPAKLPSAVTEKIIEVKRDNPSFGVKRISQWLRRVLFLQASPETVREKLHEANLMSPPSAPRKRNMTRPRFFERATPNQMWQSDIFTFRLGGRYAYVVAFMDDYSRFLVGADLFRSPTAEAVIEVYRQAIGEYKPPKEMLTDNGRQYTSWRGTSRFEAELRKDGVAHFKSRPQHPMTLGKIERFWETIWQEFLTRAQFESFEAARERIRFWIKYYNHKRPHQGIGGLCPADRFFEIQVELRKTIEAGIRENLLEMALRGQPRAPFYMVGRMEGQSVVLRAEKGKLKLELSDPQNQSSDAAPIKELVYDLNQKQPSGEAGQDGQASPAPDAQLQRDGEGAGGARRVDGAVQSGGGLPANADQLHDLSPVAATRHGGDAPSAGVPGEPGPGRGVEPAAANVASQPGRPAAEAHQTAGADPACRSRGKSGTTVVDEPLTSPSHSHPPGPSRTTDCGAGCAAVGHLPSALLQMGEARLESPAGRGGGSAQRTPEREDGPGEGIVAAPGEGTGAAVGVLPAEGTLAAETQRGAGGASR
jgi:transposase InsO family protein